MQLELQLTSLDRSHKMGQIYFKLKMGPQSIGREQWDFLKKPEGEEVQADIQVF